MGRRAGVETMGPRGKRGRSTSQAGKPAPSGRLTPKDGLRPAVREAGPVGAYLRVSSASQSLDTQRDAVTRAATARGDVVASWWEERAGAGRGAAGRPELAAVRLAARQGKLRRLYVWRLDRLSRSGVGDTLVLLRELAAYGCQVITISDPFDPTGPMGEMIAAILAWGAELERNAIQERLHAARARIEAKGGHWGRPARLGAERTAWIRRQLGQGMSVRAIAAKLGVPRSTIQRALSRWPESTPPNGALRPPKKAGKLQ